MVRDVLPSLSLCLVPNRVVCCFSMTQGEAGIKHMVFRAVVSTPCHAVRSYALRSFRILFFRFVLLLRLCEYVHQIPSKPELQAVVSPWRCW